jgi:hypothetical protein
MYEINPTELWRERQTLLLREARNRSLTRQLRRNRRARGASRTESGWRQTRFGRVIDMWGNTNVPFFRA